MNSNSQDQVVLKALDTVIFSGRKHFLSSMHPVVIVADGKPFPSVEHYYQFMKILSLAGREAAKEFVEANPEISQVKNVQRSILREYGLSKKETDKWRKEYGPRVLYYANALKYTQNRLMAKKLMDTKDKLLIEAFPDIFFSAGMRFEEVREWVRMNEGQTVNYSLDLENLEALEGSDSIANGKNVLGIVLMKLRTVLQECELMDGDTNDEVLKNILDR
ncbi:hypothetical protein QR680_016173 [Steinernema hermaphroditum]|uniref:NADAR domain-containing protein n=1 Tax=Steinernema hermaphroditum TaxID=289476 RepID=A0AA39LLI4_9BILA|nr:hypothetical protein QR680_016173 [Steinernema hermaphroditum]